MFLLDPLTLLVIAVAVVIGWRLWSVLGQRTGLERDWSRTMEKPAIKEAASVPQQENAQDSSNRWDKYADQDASLSAGLDAIASRDRAFDPEAFLSGAGRAYEMINVAFAKNDKANLQALLSRDMMKDFAADMDRRTSAAETMSWQLVKIESAKLQEASLSGNISRLSVHFKSSVISSTTNNTGAVIDGHPTAIEQVEDIWVFERPANASDPNWKLVATTPQ